MCGGTQNSSRPSVVAAGLSPRVRGNPFHAGRLEQVAGSIPACAGEPDARRKTHIQQWVYPRVCGGTAVAALGVGLILGLSPRVRGNRSPANAPYPAVWSIPACAGEPGTPSRAPRCGEVYPRVCGGTHPGASGADRGMGLSPRVRGNPAHSRPRRRRARSIPACAGEPPLAPLCICAPLVYPRVCGGTPQCRQIRPPPAVYPRVCGGTVLLAPPVFVLVGLSPRVRGNRACRRPGG